jgi:hypothetical protein
MSTKAAWEVDMEYAVEAERRAEQEYSTVLHLRRRRTSNKLVSLARDYADACISTDVLLSALEDIKYVLSSPLESPDPADELADRLTALFPEPE